MRVDLFDFKLPADRIALRPARPRDAARLLVVRPPAAFADRIVRDLPDLLRPGDVLVLNDTKVIAAELRGVRDRDGQRALIAVTLTDRAGDSAWWALARPAKRLRAGDRLRFGAAETANACLSAALNATVVENAGEGRVRLAFDLSGPALDDTMALVGHMPLPPYIAARRPEDVADRADYQTVYARAEGAVAAPTAGLHFTSELLDRLSAKNVATATVTLHVGPGTFLPVKAADTAGHKMHPEWGTIDVETAATVNQARTGGGRIVAVGTTAARLLEAAADPTGTIAPFAGETDIFIQPGHRFRAVDVLMTNFHLPRSTLFMLVSAFAGLGTMRAAYRHAIAAGYRFYSYGDACLLFPASRGDDHG